MLQLSNTTTLAFDLIMLLISKLVSTYNMIPFTMNGVKRVLDLPGALFELSQAALNCFNRLVHVCFRCKPVSEAIWRCW